MASREVSHSRPAGDEPGPNTSGDRPALVRAIGRLDLTAAIVNAVIGSAIFGIPATLASLTGAWSPLAALLAGLGFLTIILCFAEVASRFADPGGPYLYVREAFGRLLGFEVGWLIFWTRVLSAAAALNVFVLYLAALLPQAGSGPPRVVVMVTLVAVVTLVNVVGVRQATWSVDLFTLLKLMPIALLILLGLGHVRAGTLDTQAVAAPDWTQATLLLVFAYGGFEVALIPASEARDPRRDTAGALIVALGLIAAVYMLVQLVVVGVVPHAATTQAPIAAAFGELLGPPGVALASVAAMLSVCGWALGAFLQSPRVLFSMAERGDLPRGFAQVHARFRTPHVAILAFAAPSLAFGLLGGFAWNAKLAAIVRVVYYALTCLSLPALRRRPGEPPGFRLAAAPIVVPLAVGFCLWLLSTRTLEEASLLLALIAIGLPLFWLSRRADAPPNGATRP